MATRQTWLGGLTLAALAVIGWAGAERQFSGSSGNGLAGTASGIAHWLAGSSTQLEAVSEAEIVLAPNDPVLMQGADGKWQQVGVVRNHYGVDSAPVWTRRATLRLNENLFDDPARPLRLEYHTTPTALSWVADTLLPPERQAEIALLIANDWNLHRDEIVGRVQPLLEGTMQIAVKEVEIALPTVLQKHRAEFGKLADRYQSEIVRGQIVPLVGDEILPIVEDEFRSLANELGRDLWNRVSVWAFTWRFLYDASPLPERNTVQKEFDRFLADEVLPAMEARSDEFIAVTERVLRRISRNDKVRSVIRENLRTVATDPELHRILWTVVQESLIGNESLRQSLREYWSGADVQEALQLTSSRFEPTARRIGDLILGNREVGVSPEFARVLRAQILLKDHRWLVLVPATESAAPSSASSPLTITAGDPELVFPIEFHSDHESPLTKLREP